MAFEDRKAELYPQFEEWGEDAVRAEVDNGKSRLLNINEHSIAREWLYMRDRERNERIIKENAAATRRNTHIAAWSAFFAGVAAVAALLTAIITSCHSGSP